MPADITYLAPETLGRIFELGAEDEAAKVPFLLATSLVCRAWRHESQARLWHTIIFKSKNALDDSPTNTRVVDSPALGRFVTVSATFEGPREIGPKLLSGEQIPRILMSLRGLQSLVITGTKNIPATAFLGANLSALSSLTLIKAEIVDFHNVTPVPFRLKSLYLAANIDDAPYFLESVLITSGLKGITAFVPNWSDDLQVLMRVLPTHSADIEHVELGYGEWSPEVFASFPSLRRLNFFGSPELNNVKNILSRIPSSLQHFKLRVTGSPDQDRHREIIGIILDYLTKPVFGSLKSLTLPESTMEQEWLAETGFMTECKTRGITVRSWKWVVPS